MKINFLNKLFGNSEVTGNLLVDSDLTVSGTIHGTLAPIVSHYSYRYDTDGASKAITLGTLYDNNPLPNSPFVMMVHLAVQYMSSLGVRATEYAVYRCYYRPAQAYFVGTVCQKIYSELDVTGSYSGGLTLSDPTPDGRIVMSLGGITIGDEIEVGVTIK